MLICLTSVLPISVWVSVTQRIFIAGYYTSSLSKSQIRKHLLERMTMARRWLALCELVCWQKSPELLLYTQDAAYCMMLQMSKYQQKEPVTVWLSLSAGSNFSFHRFLFRCHCSYLFWSDHSLCTVLCHWCHAEGVLCHLLLCFNSRHVDPFSLLLRLTLSLSVKRGPITLSQQ